MPYLKKFPEPPSFAVLGVVSTSPGEHSHLTLILFLSKITFLMAFIIQMIKEALCNKQTHNSDGSTGERPTPLPFAS